MHRKLISLLALVLLGSRMIAQNIPEENAAASRKWLEENAKQPGVVTLPNGIQYKILKKGKGGNPSAQAQVKVHYEGRLPNGKVFDSSWKRGLPASFPLNNLIEAWKIVIPMMNKGAMWEIYCPPQFAYGERGAPPDIGPNQALIFKVKLYSFQNP